MSSKKDIVSVEKEGHCKTDASQGDSRSWNATGEDSSCESLSQLNLNWNVGNKTNSALDLGSSYLKNSMLEEVLNQKKMALLQSPDVAKLLCELQLKKQSEH